jgi:thiamine-monophosphate kinase
MTRKGAHAGDDIYVSGSLGDSAAGLEILLNKSHDLQSELEKELEYRHYYSSPRVELAQKIRHLCHSALDISDGLISDLNHILKQSGVTAWINVEQLPISNELIQYCLHDTDKYQKMALTSGEEYELCFTAPKENRRVIKQIATTLNQNVSIIGEVSNESFTNLQSSVQLYKNKTLLDWQLSGYDHFRSEV